MFNKKNKQRIAELTTAVAELMNALDEVTAERDYYKSRHIDTVTEKLRSLDETAGIDRTGLIGACPECGMDGLYHRFDDPAAHSMKHPRGREATVQCFFCGYNGGRFTQPVVPDLVSAATYDSAKHSPAALHEGVRMEPVVRREFNRQIAEDMREHGIEPPEGLDV